MHRGRQCRLENGRRRARLNGGRLGLPAAPLNHPTYGVAAAAIDTEAGPDHGPAANPLTTESNDAADARRSAARLSHAEAAVCSGPDPAPAKIRAELTSGGNHANSGIMPTPNLRPY